MFFRVLRGKYSHGGVVYGKMTKAGDVCESTINLVKRFNSPGSTKFARLSEDEAARILRRRKKTPITPPVDEDDEENEDEDVPEGNEEGEEDLESMTIKALRQIAEEEAVDLNGATKKTDIIAAIRAAQ